ncbi:galectin-4-like [Anomaloglossus baeobatrachus]|uniref:galectin-4-like n=1 Tax=Anomaloglossus baeobatrachus TaxID=238106 RepID=UPI003F4FAA0A
MAYVPAPGYQPAFNPPVPYCTMIAGGLRVGMVVTVQATLPSKYNRFAINFACGQEDTSDIALHMNARYDGRDRVVFNTKQCENWGTEEMKKEMPFKSGKVFFIMFEVTKNNYQVSANGAPFFEYGHQIPVDRVTYFQVTGDITIQELAIVGNGPGVKGGLVMSGAQSDLLPMMGPAYVNAPVPFSANIRGGMIPKRIVVVKGVVKPKAKGFIINLKSSFNNEIALHLNPRLNKNTVVRNSFTNGTWGEEETEQVKNPFKEGEYFNISILSTEQNFKVFVNGCHSFNYAHRLWNLPQVDKLEVEGDATIVYVFI